MKSIRSTLLLASLVALAACNSNAPTSPTALGASPAGNSLALTAESQQSRVSPASTSARDSEDERASGQEGSTSQASEDERDDDGYGESEHGDDHGNKDRGSRGRSRLSARLSASPTLIQSGQSSTLTWSSTNATSATLNGVSVAPSGSQVVSPTLTTMYTLVATGATGTAMATATVTVGTTTPTGPNPPTATLSANPLTIQSGGQSTLSWTTSGATSATLDGVPVTLSGSQMVSPAATKTYTLMATGAGGSTAATATVTVSAGTPPPTPGLTYTADIEPILSFGCTVCHNPTTTFAGVDLSTFTGVMRVVVPGSASSRLVTATAPTGSMYNYLIPTATHTKAQLSDLIRQWVLSGAAE